MQQLLSQGKTGGAGTPTHGARKVMEGNLISALGDDADNVRVMTLAKMFGCMPGEKIDAQSIACKVLPALFSGLRLGLGWLVLCAMLTEDMLS